MNNLNIRIKFLPLIVSSLFLLSPDVVVGQVTYRATEDALKQLIKDIEKVRKAPVKNLSTKADGEKNGVLSDRYTIQKGDTLNQIINQKLSSSPISYDILKMSIVKTNGHAFKRNNPNWMYAGKVIKFPTVSDLKDLLFKNQRNQVNSGASSSDNWVQFP